MTFAWLVLYAAVVDRAGTVLRRPRVRRVLDAATGAVLVAPRDLRVRHAAPLVREPACFRTKARTRFQASSEASANCSCLRSKKLCGAPG